MDKLSAKQRGDIQKMTTVRIINKLTAMGMDEAEIDQLDRTGLMKAWAKFVAAGKDKPAVGATPVLAATDPAYNKQLLELETRKLEADERRWKEMRELEEKRMELEKRME